MIITNEAHNLETYLKGVTDPEQLLSFELRGHSVIQCASYHDEIVPLQILCQFLKKNLGSEKLAIALNKISKDRDKFTPLHFAAFNGNIQMVEFLIENGADPFRLNTENVSVLHAAAQGD